MKAKATVSDSDLRSLRALVDEGAFQHLLCVSLERTPRRVGDIRIITLGHFFAARWAGEYA